MSGPSPSEFPPTHVACAGVSFQPVVREMLMRMAPPGFVLSFAAKPEELAERTLAEADILLVVGTVSDDMMRRAGRLRFIQKWGSGYDRIDVEAAGRHGITVAITAGTNAITIAEHALTLMLTVMRRVILADRAVREGRWNPAELRPQSSRLYGKTVGLIGFGHIGQALARLLRGFDATVLYHKRSGPVANEADLATAFVGRDELFARSDVVSLHLPGGVNRHVIDRTTIRAMKPGAILINVARGELVVEEDLVEALRNGHLSGAGLDVFAEEPLRPGSPLRGLDNVVLTPHAAGSVMDHLPLMVRHAFDNMLRFLRGEPLPAADLIVDPRRPRPPRADRPAVLPLSQGNPAP